MRIAAGAVTEVVCCPGVGEVEVTYARCDDGWRAELQVRMPQVLELAVVHRLVAPTLAEARRAVPAAAAFLAGVPIDPVG